MTSPNEGGRIALRPRARLVRALGDELISSETVAVTELVKNSYDADATDVLVRFTEPLERGRGCIELIDNGHGMSPETLSTAFLEPATPYRRSKRRTPTHNRRVLGEKGIGRFAVSRLADELSVSTREPGSDVESSLSLSWTDFDDDERFLDEIPIQWKVSSPIDFAHEGAFDLLAEVTRGPRVEGQRHGTILRMERLRHDWAMDDAIALRNSLSRLVSPFAKEAKESFHVHLQFPGELAEYSGSVAAPEFLTQPHYRVWGFVDEDGSYELDATVPNSEDAELITGTTKGRDGGKPMCGPLAIELRVWDRDRESLAPLAAQRGGTLRSLRGELDAYAGISMYRDGFRVLPYGEPRNDWLRLDMRRVQTPALRLSNNQIVGFVVISADENPELKDQSNREGLIGNRALEDLELAVLAILSEVEARRFKVRQKPPEDRSERRGLFGGLDLSELQEAVRVHAPDDAELHQMIAKSAQSVRTSVDEIQEVLSRYHRLATLGQLVDTILHDGRAPLGKIRVELTLLLRELSNGATGLASAKKVRSRLNAIEAQANALAFLFKKIEPFGGRPRGRPRRIRVEDVARDAAGLLDAEIARMKADVRISPTETLVTVEPGELQSVLYNLLANSVHWLREVSLENERVIEVNVQRTEDGAVVIEVADSGPGVDPEFADQIFEPYFSTKPQGTGLGLSHAGEIVSDYYNGQLELLESGHLGGATFRATLRYRV